MSLDEKINKYFEIELLDSMVDVQVDVKKFIKQFIKELKEDVNTTAFLEGEQAERICWKIDELAGKGLI